MNTTRGLFLLLFATLAYSQSPEVIDAKWNETYQKISAGKSALTVFRFPVDETKAVARIMMTCNQSTAANPLLVVFREKKAILSLQVPMIVQNYEYNKVGRTLCPFTDIEKDDLLTMEISSSHPVAYNFKMVALETFDLKMGEVRAVTASASEPIYLRFDILEGIDSVVVHVDSLSTICTTISIQSIGCPVFDLANNVISTGRHQTMTKSASIVVEKKDMSSFYVVFVVNPNDNLCTEMREIKRKYPSKALPRIKMFNVTIESASKIADYLVPISTLYLIIVFIYAVAIFFMVMDSKKDFDNIRRLYERLDDSFVAEESRIRYFEELMLTDDALNDYDVLTDRRDVAVLRAKTKLTVADMSLKSWAEREKKYRAYWVTLATIGLFYNLPVSQLVLNFQQTVRTSGDLDLCWYNFRCARPGFGFFAFNNIVSNSGYVLLGFLLIIMNKQRQMQYRDLVRQNPKIETSLGIPQHGGLMTTIGIAVILEGILSASYHVCPSSSNYQFDTSFMYVIGMLGMLKIYQLRHPDVHANAHFAYAFIAGSIFLSVCGVYLQNLAFWVVFSVVYMITILAISVEFYFKGVWKLNFREQWNTFRYSWAASRRCSFIVPAYLGRFMILTIANIINFGFLFHGISNRPKDFASFLLLPFIANLFLYMVYYICMKIGYKETIHNRNTVLLVLVALCWTTAGYFFLSSVSDWSKSPSESRELNKQCMIMEFYDNHDMWHFFSSVAIFISFTIINRIDDDLIFVPRNQIVVF